MGREYPLNRIWKDSFLYRSICCRRGFGVHSPFVFNLITKVIEEECPYYRYADIELFRKCLLDEERVLEYPDWRGTGKTRERSVREIVRRMAISPKQGALLFRIANYFKPRDILQIGTRAGISTLYLTSYATGLRCVALEENPALAELTEEALARRGRNPVDLRMGDYEATLPRALADMGRVDLVSFASVAGLAEPRRLFDACAGYADANTVCVFEGIRRNRKSRAFWDEIRALSGVTVSLDLYAMGIVLFNPKLHKRDYIVYF